MECVNEAEVQSCVASSFCLPNNSPDFLDHNLQLVAFSVRQIQL
jgi:hypothetical protein